MSQTRVLVTGAGGFSENTKLREVLGWELQIAEEDGIAPTNVWIEDELRTKIVADGAPAGDGALAEPVVKSA